MKTTKKGLCLLLVMILALGLAACGGNGQSSAPAPAPAPSQGGDTASPAAPSASGDKVYINIGTGGTAGTYYPLGGAMAEIWQNNIDGIIASAESTGASVANVNLLDEGQLEVVIIQNDIASYAQEGTDLFDSKVDALKGMACLYAEPLQCVTTDESIKTIADLKGKRVAVGAIGSGVNANVNQILAAAGMTDADLGEAQYLSFAEAATSLKDRQIDAAFIVAGVPTAAIVDLGTQRDVFLVPIDGEVANNLKSNYSFYTDYVIPAGTYAKQDADVMTLTVQSMLAVSADVSDDLVYDMLDKMFENNARIEAAHAVGKDITLESALEGMSIELHPGAAKFYSDKGIS